MALTFLSGYSGYYKKLPYGCVKPVWSYEETWKKKKKKRHTSKAHRYYFIFFLVWVTDTILTHTSNTPE